MQLLQYSYFQLSESCINKRSKFDLKGNFVRKELQLYMSMKNVNDLFIPVLACILYQKIDLVFSSLSQS